MSTLGKINAYTCEKCGTKTITIDRDDGVTPFIIGCRAMGGCAGLASSSCYRTDQNQRPTFEWYAPEGKELDRLDADTLYHVRRGGLLLRPIRHETREAFGFGVRAG